MIAKFWIGIQLLTIGCVTIEVGDFLKKLDENLTLKLLNPHLYNTSQLFQDLAAYSFSISRLLRLFKLKREHIMEAAKWLHNMEHPLFIRNFSCGQVKSNFQLSEKEYKNLLNFMEKITKTLSEFYKACEENPGFVSIPTPKPVFSLENYANQLESIFSRPDPNIRKYKVIKTVEDYYYTLGKFTKKFVLGRRAVMERAKELFESGGPRFLKVYDYYRIKNTYRLTIAEAASLDNLILKIRQRYEHFTNACFKNPDFKSKIDFSSVQIIQNCENALKFVLANPSVNMTAQLFKQLKDFYHVLGFLRRYNISHRSELLQALFEIFDSNGPVILRPIDYEKMKMDFQLDGAMGTKLVDYIGHLRRRFNQVQQIYLQSNLSSPLLVD